MRKRNGKSRRRRVGRVSFYPHHGSWWVYYRDAGSAVRKPVAPDEATAERIAAQINAQLSSGAPSLFSFSPATAVELQQDFVDYHEHVVRSSLATVNRYRTATRYLVDFMSRDDRRRAAHEIDADEFVKYLRTLRISPNGHAHSLRRPLRDKGVRFILETCRAMYGFAARKRRMPPYAANPFAGLGGKRFRIEDAKRVFVFDERLETAFLAACDDWSFPIHFVLAKTGVRPGELVHAMIDDLDLDTGWWCVCNKPELGWRVKTRRERPVPLVHEVVQVLRRVIGDRQAGPVFVRPDAARALLHNANEAALSRVVERRVLAAESALSQQICRTETARIHRAIWRDAGGVRVDAIRVSFMRTAQRAGLEAISCPKSWRHTFATLLQDANVDPLIRQLTLGHSPTAGPESALGMTALYTHTRPQTQKREIERALSLWPKSLELGRRWISGDQT